MFTKPVFQGEKFYVDQKSLSVQDVSAVEKGICELGGVVECFLSKDVSFLVTSNDQCTRDIVASPGSQSSPQLLNNNNNTSFLSRGKALLLKSKTLAPPPTDVLDTARQLGIKIVSFACVQQRINKLLAKSPASAPSGSKIKRRQSRPHLLKNNYIKFEDTEQEFRPVTSSFNVFPYVDSSVDHSGSPFETVKPKAVEKVEKAVEKLAPLSNSQTKAKEKRKPLAAKNGYCELCACHFEDLTEHVKAATHVKYMENKENFKELDDTIAKLPTLTNFVADVRLTSVPMKYEDKTVLNVLSIPENDRDDSSGDSSSDSGSESESEDEERPEEEPEQQQQQQQQTVCDSTLLPAGHLTPNTPLSAPLSVHSTLTPMPQPSPQPISQPVSQMAVFSDVSDNEESDRVTAGLEYNGPEGADMDHIHNVLAAFSPSNLLEEDDDRSNDASATRLDTPPDTPVVQENAPQLPMDLSATLDELPFDFPDFQGATNAQWLEDALEVNSPSNNESSVVCSPVPTADPLMTQASGDFLNQVEEPLKTTQSPTKQVPSRSKSKPFMPSSPSPSIETAAMSPPYASKSSALPLSSAAASIPSSYPSSMASSSAHFSKASLASPSYTPSFAPSTYAPSSASSSASSSSTAYSSLASSSSASMAPVSSLPSPSTSAAANSAFTSSAASSAFTSGASTSAFTSASASTKSKGSAASMPSSVSSSMPLSMSSSMPSSMSSSMSSSMPSSMPASMPMTSSLLTNSSSSVAAGAGNPLISPHMNLPLGIPGPLVMHPMQQSQWLGAMMGAHMIPPGAHMMAPGATPWFPGWPCPQPVPAWDPKLNLTAPKPPSPPPQPSSSSSSSMRNHRETIEPHEPKDTHIKESASNSDLYRHFAAFQEELADELYKDKDIKQSKPQQHTMQISDISSADESDTEKGPMIKTSQQKVQPPVQKQNSGSADQTLSAFQQLEQCLNVASQMSSIEEDEVDIVEISDKVPTSKAQNAKDSNTEEKADTADSASNESDRVVYRHKKIGNVKLPSPHLHYSQANKNDSEEANVFQHHDSAAPADISAIKHSYSQSMQNKHLSVHQHRHKSPNTSSPSRHKSSHSRHKSSQRNSSPSQHKSSPSLHKSSPSNHHKSSHLSKSSHKSSPASRHKEKSPKHWSSKHNESSSHHSRYNTSNNHHHHHAAQQDSVDAVSDSSIQNKQYVVNNSGGASSKESHSENNYVPPRTEPSVNTYDSPTTEARVVNNFVAPRTEPNFAHDSGSPRNEETAVNNFVTSHKQTAVNHSITPAESYQTLYTENPAVNQDSQNKTSNHAGFPHSSNTYRIATPASQSGDAFSEDSMSSYHKKSKKKSSHKSSHKKSHKSHKSHKSSRKKSSRDKEKSHLKSDKTCNIIQEHEPVNGLTALPEPYNVTKVNFTQSSVSTFNEPEPTTQYSPSVPQNPWSERRETFTPPVQQATQPMQYTTNARVPVSNTAAYHFESTSAISTVPPTISTESAVVSEAHNPVSYSAAYHFESTSAISTVSPTVSTENAVVSEAPAVRSSKRAAKSKANESIAKQVHEMEESEQLMAKVPPLFRYRDVRPARTFPTPDQISSLYKRDTGMPESSLYKRVPSVIASPVYKLNAGIVDSNHHDEESIKPKKHKKKKKHKSTHKEQPSVDVFDFEASEFEHSDVGSKAESPNWSSKPALGLKLKICRSAITGSPQLKRSPTPMDANAKPCFKRRKTMEYGGDSDVT